MGFIVGPAAAANARQLARLIAALLVALVLINSVQVAHASDLTGANLSATSRFSSDPLAGRFGSTIDDFETAYGEPLDEDPQPYPLGLAYEISDFGGGTAHAYFEDDRLIYLTIVPDQGSWDASELLNVMSTVLPSDFANGWVGEETAERFVLNVQSADLAAVVDSDIYDTYDAGIWPGDLNMYVRMTPEGNLASVEFGLGWEVQEFETTDPADDEEDGTAGDANEAEAEYLAAVTSDFEMLTNSIERFGEILNDPSFGDQDSIEEIDEILTSWITVYTDAALLTPPSGYEEIHAAYLDFTGLLADAAMDLTYGDTESAAEGLVDAVEKAEILTELLEDASRPEIFDVKSGYVLR